MDKELKAHVEGTLKKVREIGYREVETAGLGAYSPQQFRTAHERFGAAKELEAKLRTSVKGEIRFDEASRALYATDASNYRRNRNHRGMS